MSVELDEEKFAYIGGNVVQKFMEEAEEEEEGKFYMYIGVHVLSLFGEMLFGKKGDNDGSKE